MWIFIVIYFRVLCNFSLSYSLRYFSVSIERDNQEPLYLEAGYVDDIEIVRFDSSDADPKMRPKVSWIQESSSFWDTETEGCVGDRTIFKSNLKVLLRYYNQSGKHIIQRMCGCQGSSNGTLIHGYDQYAYDGKDYIMLTDDLQDWQVTDMYSKLTKDKWDGQNRAQVVRAYLEIDCPEWVQKYVINGTRAGAFQIKAPQVFLTEHHLSDHEVNLKCWALNFYPADIYMMWMKDGEDQAQDIETIETRPSGDGTYQKWVAIVVSPQERQRYQCEVQHVGQKTSVTSKLQSSADSGYGGSLTGIFVVTVALGVGISVVIWRKKLGSKIIMYRRNVGVRMESVSETA
ncbi:membrane protein S11 [Saimiriine betaherpesvirus 4]|uniref:Membrane protein S11 n=1 Tax=Saimiriine betaherpesvirus 4 TaxID=1535247 RepID=G8XST2_9BETA|nr:membrane protein S11 [Saimiriine betaherpesvirus 4]AEV80879.1 membrane protein S11 [Saimiriine betaherpesvirus 4]